MKTRQFWYPLPERLIAQHPAERRGTDRMLVLHRATGVLEHRHIADIVDYLDEKDLLVVNDTKVFPARLLGTWADSPGAVEVLMVSPAPSREGQVAVFGPNRELTATLVKRLEGGLWRVAFTSERPLAQLLDEFGHTPVPPYVHREGTAEEERADRARYQTIYAKHVGSVAAPTAGLHFTPEMNAAGIYQKGKTVILFFKVFQVDLFRLGVWFLKVVNQKFLKVANHNPARPQRVGHLIGIAFGLLVGCQHTAIALLVGFMKVDFRTFLLNKNFCIRNISIDKRCVREFHAFFKFDIFCRIVDA